jgi:hypothetical protein
MLIDCSGVDVLESLESLEKLDGLEELEELDGLEELEELESKLPLLPLLGGNASLAAVLPVLGLGVELPKHELMSPEGGVVDPVETDGVLVELPEGDVDGVLMLEDVLRIRFDTADRSSTKPAPACVLVPTNVIN